VEDPEGPVSHDDPSVKPTDDPAVKPTEDDPHQNTSDPASGPAGTPEREADRRSPGTPAAAAGSEPGGRKVPESKGGIFAVFRNADGILHALAGRYDAETGKPVFETEPEGDYTLITLDFDSEDFSDEFRKVLNEQFDGVFPAQVLTMTPEEYAETFGGEYPAAFVEEFYSVLEKLIGEMDS